MVSPSRSSAEKCTRQGSQRNTGGIAFKWQRQWVVILLQHTSSGIIMNRKKAGSILKQRTGILLNSSGSASRKECGSYCGQAHTFVPNGILEGSLLTCLNIPISKCDAWIPGIWLLLNDTSLIWQKKLHHYNV